MFTDHTLQGCVHIGDEALYQLVRRCSRLQLVNLHGCRNVQDDGVMELAENSPALRYLYVESYFHDSKLRAGYKC